MSQINLFDSVTNNNTTAPQMEGNTALKTAQAAPAPRIFTSIISVIEAVRTIGDIDALPWPAFIQLREDIRRQGPQILVMVQAMTKEEIYKYVYKHSSSESKAQIVDRLFNSFLGSFTLNEGVMYSPFSGETYEMARDKVLNKITEEQYIKYCEEQAAERAARKKALTNPETLEEFRTFVRYKGVNALTSDQKITYDRLITDANQEKREKEEAQKAATVKTVNVSDSLQMEIKNSYHAKKQIPLWVVTMSDRVDSDTFNALKERAKKFDGYYSSYRGNGAIPGFTFEVERNAQLFTQIKDGNINAMEVYEENQAERTEQRADTLAEKAERITENATEELNRDRKDNTWKRAQQANHAERQALANIAFAQTMQQIADGIRDGNIKYLTKLQNIAELETLYRIINSAKYTHQRAQGVRYEEQKLTMEAAEYIKYPLPTVWIKNVYSTLSQLTKVSGRKMAAARILKAMAAHKKEDEIFTFGPRLIDDFETCFCQSTYKIIDQYEARRYREDLMHYKRVQRLGFLSMPELRTACRELMTIMLSSKLTPEQKRAQEIRELERTFISKDIPGFFPTPEELAKEIVSLAQITEGCTILEPSAGLGHLADQISTHAPNNQLTCIEANYSLYKALELKGYTVEHGDFLQHSQKYDRIIMNPPFENGQDIDHVIHAYNLLNEGGRLVAIMAGNKQKQDRKTIEFMELVDRAGSSFNNPEGAFLSSFRPTGVNTITVILEK